MFRVPPKFEPMSTPSSTTSSTSSIVKSYGKSSVSSIDSEFSSNNNSNSNGLSKVNGNGMTPKYQVQPRLSRSTNDPAPPLNLRSGVNPKRKLVKSNFRYEAEADDELDLEPGDIVVVLEEVDPGWWIGELLDSGSPNKTGLFPSAYCAVISDSPPTPPVIISARPSFTGKPMSRSVSSENNKFHVHNLSSSRDEPSEDEDSVVSSFSYAASCNSSSSLSKNSPVVTIAPFQSSMKKPMSTSSSASDGNSIINTASSMMAKIKKPPPPPPKRATFTGR